MKQTLVLQEAAILTVKENNPATLTEDLLKYIALFRNNDSWLVPPLTPTAFLN